MTPQELSVKDKQEVAGEERTRPGRAYIPDMDVYETRDALFLSADMPGVDERSVDVNLTNGVLAIEGHVKVQEYENLSPVYIEYNVGNFVRRLSLPDDIDATHIKARLTNGVLEIELPKSEHAK